MDNAHQSTHDYIMALASKNGISGQPTETDRMGEAITRLADNDVVHNEATRSLIAMQARRILSNEEAGRLLNDLLDEMEPSDDI